MNSSNFVWWISAALALPICVTVAFSPPVLPIIVPSDASSGPHPTSSVPPMSTATYPSNQVSTRQSTTLPRQLEPQVPPPMATPLSTTTPPQTVSSPASSPQPANPPITTSAPTSTPAQNLPLATSTPATSTPATSTPLVRSDSATPSSGSVPAGYELAFSDEFKGSSLDRSKWKTRYIYANETLDFLNDEQQRYRDGEHHIVSDGTLKLVATKAHSDKRYAAYESGMVRSAYTFRYGYVEARVKLPDGRGVWPAFWLNSDYASDKSLTWPPEIDIFEYVVNGREELPDMLHMGVISHGAQGHSVEYRDRNFNRRWSYYKNPGGSLAGEWHVIGALWNENGVTMYLDGEKIVTFGYKWVYDNGKEAAPAHILLNLAIGGSWAGKYGIDDSKFPQTFEIDYVRAYTPSS